eukprot:TRINITY_DN6323_c0_g1_i1.p1 TRINITY_DN6323_c0_g1~~TRINITY_DN6323_c0_g1_i1.p1  ORF type:complete len:200 (+),score=2.20 TRINITY_DN6323_c0_g1_i1:79-678(+)
MLKLDVQKSHISNKYVMNEVCILRYNIIFVGRDEDFFLEFIDIFIIRNSKTIKSTVLARITPQRSCFFSPLNLLFQNAIFTKKKILQVIGGELGQGGVVQSNTVCSKQVRIYQFLYLILKNYTKQFNSYVDKKRIGQAVYVGAGDNIVMLFIILLQKVITEQYIQQLFLVNQIDRSEFFQVILDMHIGFKANQKWVKAH